MTLCVGSTSSECVVCIESVVVLMVVIPTSMMSCVCVVARGLKQVASRSTTLIRVGSGIVVVAVGSDSLSGLDVGIVVLVRERGSDASGG